MIKTLIVYLSLNLFMMPLQSLACTIAELPNKTIIHNVDWFEKIPGSDGMIVLNPSRLKKSGLLYGAKLPAAEWISRLRSISFSIAGAEFPVGGFNEKGLLMGVLMLNYTKFPVDGDVRKALSVTQFVQYNLDLSSTIEDVIRSGDKVRPYSPALKMHYFACDALGKCAVFQFIDGELKIYSDVTIKTKRSTISPLNYRILTNSPYPESVRAADDCVAKHECHSKNLSLWRFSEMNFLLSQIGQSSIGLNTSFDMLNIVAQTQSLMTRFQLVYDPITRRINFRRGGQNDYAYVDADFSKAKATGRRKVILIKEDVHGNLSNSWTDLTPEMQYDIVLKSGQSAAAAKIAGRYPFDVVSCIDYLK